MAVVTPDRVPVLAGVLSLGSLALVFGAVGGAVPHGLLPRVDALVELIPHLNAGLSLAAIATISLGLLAIHRGQVARHRTAMLVSTGLFALFLVLYLYRISLTGPTTFPGPDTIRLYVYLPILAIHILLAMLCIPFVYYSLLLAIAHPVAELPQTNHSRAGRIAAVLWLLSFSLGVTVYLLLHHLY